MPKFSVKSDIEYAFVIKRISDGQFKNLWSLEIKTPSNPVLTELVDADQLSTVISKIGFVFEQDGL